MRLLDDDGWEMLCRDLASCLAFPKLLSRGSCSCDAKPSHRPASALSQLEPVAPPEARERVILGRQVKKRFKLFIQLTEELRKA